MARLDIDGCLASIGEEQGRMAAALLRAALADLGLSPEVQRAAGERIGHHLRRAADRARRELGPG